MTAKSRIKLCSTLFLQQNQQDAPMYQVYFILEWHSTCFRRSFRPSSGVQDCTYTKRHLSSRYCCLPASVYQMELFHLVPASNHSLLSLTTVSDKRLFPHHRYNAVYFTTETESHFVKKNTSCEQDAISNPGYNLSAWPDLLVSGFSVSNS